MPHFLTLSSFSTATPRETSSAELAALWFDDPEETNRRQQQKKKNPNGVHFRFLFPFQVCMAHGNEW